MVGTRYSGGATPDIMALILCLDEAVFCVRVISILTKNTAYQNLLLSTFTKKLRCSEKETSVL